MKGMINVVRNFINKIIVFFIPFLFVLNIYADESKVVTYKYKTSDAEYILSAYFDKDGLFYKSSIIERTSSNSGFDSKEIKNYIGEFSYMDYGITGFSDSMRMLRDSYDNDTEGFFNELDHNAEKYKPLLYFTPKDSDGNRKVIVVGFIFKSGNFKDSNGNLDEEKNNLNDFSQDFIDQIFSGQLDFFSDFYGKYVTNNLYEKFNIDKNYTSTFESTTTDSKSSGEEDFRNYTAGSCESHAKILRDMREMLMYEYKSDGSKTKGYCSSKDLNTMQEVASIYDLQFNFDTSVLEEKCADFVFGTNGYISRIIDAQVFYNNMQDDPRQSEKKIKTSLVCLTVESEYLNSIGTITSYSYFEDKTKIDPCELISPKLKKIMNEVFDAVKVLGISVCIFLCIVDVYKMVVTKESDTAKLKKVLVKRIIALLALFLIPLFINIVTELINDRYLKNNPDKCPSIIGE